MILLSYALKNVKRNLYFYYLYSNHINPSIEMMLSQSEHAILKKVNLEYSEEKSSIKIISINNELRFNEIESIKIEKAVPTFIKKLRFWIFIFFDDNNYPNKAKRAKLNYKYAKSVTINLLNSNTIKSYHTAFDLITTSKIIKKINQEINTPFKHRV